jgi:serine/threonine protein phosphatase PrpC
MISRFALAAAAATHPGRVRENNEDHYWLGVEQRLFVLGDGLGGYQGGELASKLAVESFRDHILEAGTPDPEQVGNRIQDAMLFAHNAVRSRAQTGRDILQMGTTLVALWWPFDEASVWVAHVGDSRAYLYRDGELKGLTGDHTVYRQIVLSGSQPPGGLDPALKKVLSQAVGSSDVISPSVNRLESRESDRFALCSDGLTDMLSEDQLADLLGQHGRPQETCDELVQLANQAGGVDNITVIIADVGREEGDAPMAFGASWAADAS